MNIVTMEDPVEYSLDGINQGQINVKAGFTFADGMRSILRQDPDVIMIGEMRDKETCEMAIQAALTGPSGFNPAYERFRERFYPIAGNGVGAVFSSARPSGPSWPSAWCGKCVQSAELYQPDKEALEQIGLKPGISMYKAKGCHYCNNSGYKGRSGIFEFLLPDYQVKKMVLEHQSSDAVKQYLQNGADSMSRRDGLRKVVEGFTTLEQVLGSNAE